MVELFAVALITILAVISPGADFAMVTRNSVLFGRSAGLFASLGIATGVQLHVLYTMLGVGLLIKTTPQWFFLLKIVGAFYLIYVGYKTFVSLPAASGGQGSDEELDAWGAFRTGFLTNALNPKTTLFVVSVYTQVVNAGTPLTVQIGYGLFMSLAHWLWFSVVTLFFSEERLRSRMLQRQVTLNRFIGLVLVGLGISLLFATTGVQANY